MYKVLIVDDEDLIRQGLITFVNWKAMGFEIVGEAADGNQAFEMIQKLKPHVVLTDIKMPGCTGIDLMKKIRNAGISVKIVVLSGYDEFEYAKTALEVGAIDYLLKPIKFDKLNEVFSKIKEESDIKIVEKIKINRAMELMKDQLFSKIISGVIKNPGDIVKQAEELNVKLDWKYYLTIIIELDDFRELTQKYSAQDLDLYKFMIRNISEEICSKYGEGYTFVVNNSEVVILFGSDSDESAQVKSLAYEIKSSIDSTLDFTITVSVGDVFKSISALHDAYIQCRKRANKKFILGKDRVIFPEDVIVNEGVTCNTDGNIEGKLLLLLQNRNMEELDKLIDIYFSTLVSKDVICSEYFSIIRVISKYLEKNGININDWVDSSNVNYTLVNGKETLSDIVLELKTTIKKIVNSMEKEDFKNESSVISEVKEFVNQHLGEDISLEIVAQKVYMHPMYLSKIFKKETGINFIDFLTNVRVNRAKQMMHDLTLKTYEISEMVGYKSAKHFSKVFKIAVGVTPKDYRKNLLGYEE